VKTEEQLLAMYAQANPIELDELLEMVRDVQVDDLPAPRTGTGELIDLDTSNRQPTEKRSAAPWLVAAAAIVVLGTALILITRESAPDTATQATIIENLDEWLQMPYENEGEAGTYRTRVFPVSFSYTVPSDWHSHDTPGVVHIYPIPADGDAHPEEGQPLDLIVVQSVIDAVGPVSPMKQSETVDRWIENFMEVEGINLTEPVEIVMGGAPGKTFEVWAVGDQPVVIDERDPEDSEDDWRLPPKPGLLMYVVTVGYETVVIYVDAAATGYDFHEVARPIIDSIVWRDLN